MPKPRPNFTNPQRARGGLGSQLQQIRRDILDIKRAPVRAEFVPLVVKRPKAVPITPPVLEFFYVTSSPVIGDTGDPDYFSISIPTLYKMTLTGTVLTSVVRGQATFPNNINGVTVEPKTGQVFWSYNTDADGALVESLDADLATTNWLVSQSAESIFYGSDVTPDGNGLFIDAGPIAVILDKSDGSVVSSFGVTTYGYAHPFGADKVYTKDEDAGIGSTVNIYEYTAGALTATFDSGRRLSGDFGLDKKNFLLVSYDAGAALWVFYDSSLSEIASAPFDDLTWFPPTRINFSADGTFWATQTDQIVFHKNLVHYSRTGTLLGSIDINVATGDSQSLPGFGIGL